MQQKNFFNRTKPTQESVERSEVGKYGSRVTVGERLSTFGRVLVRGRDGSFTDARLPPKSKADVAAEANYAAAEADFQNHVADARLAVMPSGRRQNQSVLMRSGLVPVAMVAKGQGDIYRPPAQYYGSAADLNGLIGTLRSAMGDYYVSAAADLVGGTATIDFETGAGNSTRPVPGFILDINCPNDPNTGIGELTISVEGDIWIPTTAGSGNYVQAPFYQFTYQPEAIWSSIIMLGASPNLNASGAPYIYGWQAYEDNGALPVGATGLSITVQGANGVNVRAKLLDQGSQVQELLLTAQTDPQTDRLTVID